MKEGVKNDLLNINQIEMLITLNKLEEVLLTKLKKIKQEKERK